MKFFLTLMVLLVTQATRAMPYVCETPELDNGKAMLRFKVNPKRPVMQGKNEWDLYLIGVTPSNDIRQIVYGSGTADNKTISLTFVKDSFVLGSVIADIHKDGLYYGKASISGIHKNKKLDVVCRDEQPSK